MLFHIVSTRLAFLLKVHIQTIGILVSEKTELQTALAHTQQAARQKAGGNLGTLLPLGWLGLWWDSFSGLPLSAVISGESEDLANRLQSSRQRVGELERTLSAVSTQQKQADRVSPAACPSPGGHVDGL